MIGFFLSTGEQSDKPAYHTELPYPVWRIGCRNPIPDIKELMLYEVIGKGAD